MSRRPSVAVIGAGAGGIAMGARLAAAGFDFTIYEAADGVGGTWRYNTYPGAACDVPSHLYSYSFDLNPDWSRTYASQAEILAYLERCVASHGLEPHLRLGTAVRRIRWDDDAGHWELETDGGALAVADVVVSAVGMLNVPVVPAIPGADRFGGRAFHSARWDHDAPLAGRRVASIGTGASAIQYVPAIAGEVEHLTVFQRTPVWVSPRIERDYTEDEQRRFARFPFLMRWHRWQIWWAFERARFETDSPHVSALTELARSYLERKVADPDLRAKLTPDHPVGCKRPLTSRTWYPALCRPNVRLVTEPIAGICEEGIRTADGELHEVDTIIYGTGFRASEFLTTIEVEGRDGARLADRWQDGAEAYLGLSVPGFPNLFTLYGPNTNGVNSIIFIHEAQVHFVMAALRLMGRLGLGSLEVRAGANERYNRRIQADMADKVWLAGCHNYFRTESGRVTTQLPHRGSWYWLRTRGLPVWNYHLRRRPASRVASP